MREAYQRGVQTKSKFNLLHTQLAKGCQSSHSFHMKTRLLHFQLSFLYGSNPSPSMLVHETELR